MVLYQPMDPGHPMPTCLHGGAIPLSECCPGDRPAYAETVSDLPHGTVADELARMAERYGACGMMAVEDGMVVGKLRFYPQGLIDLIGIPCVQQERCVRGIIGFNADTDDGVKPSVLHLWCFQVAEGHKGKGVSLGLLDATIAWARANGYRGIRANAVRGVPPLLNWCGQPALEALLRRGFKVIAERHSPELMEGVVAQRRGDHGDGVREQWLPYRHLSDTEASVVHEMQLDIGRWVRGCGTCTATPIHAVGGFIHRPFRRGPRLP